jgi:hypothetical protein
VFMTGDIITIESLEFREVFLRMNPHGVDHPLPLGGGTVNCQFGAGQLERFRVHVKHDPDEVVSFESVAIPGTFLRMDADHGERHGVPDGFAGGKVNCQFGGEGPLERFRVVRTGNITEVHSEDHFAAIIIRPGTVDAVRMDATGFSAPHPSGGGIVNVSFGAGIFSNFIIKRLKQS